MVQEMTEDRRIVEEAGRKLGLEALGVFTMAYAELHNGFGQVTMDLATDEWYRYKKTGQAPAPVKKFCTKQNLNPGLSFTLRCPIITEFDPEFQRA